MSKPLHNPGFQHKSAYERFLASGRVTATHIYSSLIMRASRTLNEFITPATLSSVTDLDRIMELIRPEGESKPRLNSIRCALLAYVRMVNSNFEGLFPGFAAAATPTASDLDFNERPERIRQEVYRFIRDTVACREIKVLYESKCQICGEGLEIAPNQNYSEAHHIQPLGGDHQGPDIRNNLICVCPNHHAQLDYFAIKINLATLKLNEHLIDPVFVRYHNDRVKSNLLRKG